MRDPSSYLSSSHLLRALRLVYGSPVYSVPCVLLGLGFDTLSKSALLLRN